MLCISLMPVAAWPVYILLLALILSAAILSELRMRPLLRRSMVALPFALAALPLLLTVPGQTAVALRLGPLHLAVTVPGVERFASIVVRSWLSVQVAILLTATTQLPDLLVAMGQLHMPRLLVAILSLMWRYLAVLVDEAIRMMRARDARSASWCGRGVGKLAWRTSVTESM
ncbi:MAG TPA: energy-coupling factor transporter transmembrane component T, partial [Anaerolineae bacterium]|nr:energy-coupling factor transporter transmembrane component T [Anaerolineae bacterium]